jgi:hypothetical protein
MKIADVRAKSEDKETPRENVRLLLDCASARSMENCRFCDDSICSLKSSLLINFFHEFGMHLPLWIWFPHRLWMTSRTVEVNGVSGFHEKNVESVESLKISTKSFVLNLTFLGSVPFERLESLYVSHVNLHSLEGISGLRRLRELFCAFNLIADLDPLWGHDGLEVLDLENNSLIGSGNIMILSTVSNLRELTLIGNKMMFAPQLSDEAWIRANFPNLRFLNDKEIRGKMIQQRPDSTASTAPSTRSSTPADPEVSVSENRQRPLTPIPPRPQSASRTIRRTDSFSGNPLHLIRSRTPARTGKAETIFPVIADNPFHRKIGPVRALPLIKRP